MKKNNFSHFGFSTLLLAFTMICIVTFSALSFVTAHSDYNLSKRVADNNSAYYEASEKIQDEISQIDVMLASSYQSSPDKTTYFDTVLTALSSDKGVVSSDEDSSISSNLSYTITENVSETQTLTVTLNINYPSHKYDAFYTIKEWKLITNTSFSEDDTLNLIGGN